MYVYDKYVLSVVLRMTVVSDETCREIETRILCSVTFSSESLDIYVIIWKDMAESHKPQMAI
jgi:hypothetical protein